MIKSILKMAFIAMVAVIYYLPASAQSLTNAAIKEQLIVDWQRAKAYTLEYLNAMPADKYSYKATDSTRSFAGHMLHLSTVNVRLMAYALELDLPDYAQSDFQHRLSAETKDSVLFFVNNSYDFAINAVKKSDTLKWGEKKKIFDGTDQLRFALLQKTFEHQTHHRGQCTIYLRLLGIKPPDEKLF